MRNLIVSLKQYYSRGATWFSYLFQFGLITANAKLFEDFFKTVLGWDVITTIAVGIIGYIVFATMIGAVDRRHGIWWDENDWVWNSTPEARALSARVKRIEETVCADSQIIWEV